MTQTPEEKQEWRVRHWQKIAIDQLGYALNLFLVLSVAVLGFWFELLRDVRFLPGSTAKCFMLLSLWSFGFSVIFGLACVLNRLRDFRGTAQRAHENPEAPGRDELRSIGRVTWSLFYAQVGSFAFGALTLGTALLLTYGRKLA